MIIQRRTTLIMAGIAVLLLASILVVPALLNADRYRLKAISYLEESTGKKIEIGRLALTFFPQVAIHVENFGAKSPPLFPPSYVLKVARVDAQIDFWALLHRELVIRSLVLEQPMINLISDPDGPWNFENPKAKNKPNSFVIGTISRVKINRGPRAPVEPSALRCSGTRFLRSPGGLQRPRERGCAGHRQSGFDDARRPGNVESTSLKFGSIEAKNLTSTIRLQSRQVSFTNVKAETYGGTTSGEFSFKFSGKKSSFKTDATMKRIDVARLLTAFKNASGKMTGRMEGELKIAGDIEHSERPLEGLHGSGHLTVRDGQVPSLKLNANLMKLAHYNDLGPAKNDPSSFNFVSTDLELDHERLSSKVIDIDGYGVDVDGSGVSASPAPTS